MNLGKNNGLKTGAIIVLVLATISFVFLPMFQNFGSRQDEIVFGTWDGTKIKQTQESVFNTQINFLANTAEQYGLLPKNASHQQNFNLFYGAYRASVIQIAMQQEAHNAGFIASPDVVNKELLTYFSDETGVYSPLRFEQTTDMRKARLRKDVCQQQELNRYVDDFFGVEKNGFGLKMSDNEAKVLRSIAKNEKKFKYIVFTNKLYPQAKIINYAKEHQELFASYNLKMLSFDNEQTAKNALAQLKKNELSFDDAVATLSTKKGTDELGRITPAFRFNINALISDAEELKSVLEAKPNTDTLLLVRTQSGWGIIKCVAKAEVADFEQQTTVEAASNYVKTHEKGLVEDYLVKHAEAFKTKLKEQSFEKTAQDENLTVISSVSFSVNYGNSPLLNRIAIDKDPVIGRLVSDADFFSSVFSLSENEVSKPILADGDVLLFVAEKTQPVDENVLTALESSYKSALTAWQAYYPVTAFLLSNPLKIGQQTLFNFILNNEKFDDHFFEVFNHLQ